MSKPILHPSDMVEELVIAICMYTEQPQTVQTSDIKLMQLYDCKSKKYLRCFYGIEKDGLLFGNLIGTPYIVVCSEDSFIFKESVVLWLLLAQSEDGSFYRLTFIYDPYKCQLSKSYLDKRLPNGDTVRLKKFSNIKQVLEKANDIIFDDMYA